MHYLKRKKAKRPSISQDMQRYNHSLILFFLQKEREGDGQRVNVPVMEVCKVRIN